MIGRIPFLLKTGAADGNGAGTADLYRMFYRKVSDPAAKRGYPGRIRAVIRTVCGRNGRRTGLKEYPVRHLCIFFF